MAERQDGPLKGEGHKAFDVAPFAAASFSAMSRDAAESSGPELRTADTASRAETYLATKRRERDEAIDNLVADALKRGQAPSRAFWAMVYDFELAPLTTNRAQLASMGIDAPAPADLGEAELAARLASLVDGLARLSIYLMNTGHLTDRALYERLVGEVLDEEVRDLAGCADVHEWVDMDAGGNGDGSTVASDRDERLPRPAPRESRDD